MLDAICNFDPDNLKTYSIFEFKALSESEIDKLRYALLCPACGQQAYFRRASKDGRQACFGSRYHDKDCAEFNPTKRKVEEEKQVAEVEQIILSEDSLTIDFSALTVVEKISKLPLKINETRSEKHNTKAIQEKKSQLIKEKTKVNNPGLAKLLTSLLRGSSLASSDILIYTSEKYKWRAKNLFVNIAEAEPTENGAPRMYWGTISHADKTLNWLNPAENRSVGLPIGKFREEFLARFSVQESADVEGAGFIIFGKCTLSTDKKRKYIQLWQADIQYFYLSKSDI